MTTLTDRNDLDARRQEKGLSVAKVAKGAQINYQRLWRFFMFQSDLDEGERQRLESLLGSEANTTGEVERAGDAPTQERASVSGVTEATA